MNRVVVYSTTSGTHDSQLGDFVMYRLVVVVLGLIVGCIDVRAASSLNGSIVTVNLLGPTSTTVDVGQAVSVGPPFPEVACPGGNVGGGICSRFGLPAQLTIQSSSITLAQPIGAFSFPAGTYNGVGLFGLTFDDGSALTNFKLTTNLSGFTRANVSFTPTSIQFNLSGTSFSNGFFIQLDLQTTFCPIGATISGVILPRVNVIPTLSRKPWRISYAELSLDFSISGSAGICTALSNAGALGVNFSFGTFTDFHIADSIATAQLSAFQPSTVGPLQSCNFALFSGINNNCLLNGPFDPSASYASWSTTGFHTVPLPTVQAVIQHPNTGPLNFWVNLDRLGLSTSNTSMDMILRGTEPYIHRTLIDNLPYFAWYTVIQDPGNVTILVVNTEGLTAGTLPNGAVTYDIPQSLLYPSTTNPAVVFPNLQDGTYEIILTGISSGDYELSVSGTSINHQSTQQVVTGALLKSASVSYHVSLTTSTVGQSQTISLGTIVLGDLNGDEHVDCKDLAVVKASFGRKTGQQGFNAWADLNSDGVVDIRDLAIVSQRLPVGTRCQ